MMSDLDARALEAFARYLSTLPEDARKIGRAVADTNLELRVRTPLTGALNYLFKSLDLIDDGIEALGFLDDALILRVAVAQAAKGGSLPEGLSQLAADAVLVSEFLGEQTDRFERYVASLTAGEVRGRSVEAILGDPAAQEEFLGEVSGWAHRYDPPTFLNEPKNLVKLKAFLEAKLPR
jgi:uncharacterized membrane protein YkvA (DUF1232 family)